MTADGLRLRASPAFELVPYERLSAAARRRHAALLGEAGFYGLLRPRGRGAARVVDRESALLLHTLRAPGPLPAYLGRGQAAAAALAGLRALVLDGVVEVAARGGRFATGAAALALLDAAAAPPDLPRGRPAALSAAALRLGAALAPLGAAEVARRLYAFNREPLTPARGRAVPNATAVRRALGLAPAGALARRIARHWRDGADRGAWASWAPRRAPGHPGEARGVKLYVSPVADDLPAALAALVEALAAAGPAPFKVARRPDGLLRPDKLVAYFPSLDLLRRATARLEPAVRGLRAQGVPFTAAVTDDGLLSWGADPPDRALGSWRAWLCGRLAEHVVAASRAGVRDAAAEAARRVAADGVNPATWAPAGA